MRRTIIVGLVGCGLLFIFGVGFYSQYPSQVNDWLRGLGRKHTEPDEVIVEQGRTANLPDLDGVKVRVGDIKRGRNADVDILGPDSAVLASKASAQVGDRIPFTHDGKKYEVEVVEYHDKLGKGDWARIRLIPLAVKKDTIQGTWKVEEPHEKYDCWIVELEEGFHVTYRMLRHLEKPTMIWPIMYDRAEPDKVVLGASKASGRRATKAGVETMLFIDPNNQARWVKLTRISDKIDATIEKLARDMQKPRQR